MTLLVACAFGVASLEIETGELELIEGELPSRLELSLSLPLLVAADRVGARVVALVDARPPLLVSDDAGTTWRESGAGLPRGVAVAIDENAPDRVAFATGERLYLSHDGAVFWHALPIELPQITGIAWTT
ncbi:MAG: hypothetical protein U0R50_06910 [Gaiellales bacterium]